MDVSIIIPTYNRSEAIKETLQVLASSDYPQDRWEAVIVDDGSTDDTEVAVCKWRMQERIQAQYLRQENAGAAAARNRGAWAARGGILIFIDNDILVPPDFIRQHLRVLNENPGCWILGRVVQPSEMRLTPFGRFRDDFHESFFRAVGPYQLTETNGMSTANVSLPKADFIALCGFDESFPGASCEDWELAMRARQRGIRVLFAPTIAVLHNDWAVSLEQFCRRQKLYSIPQVLLWKKYGEASPWARLVCENAPVDWQKDSLPVILKKGLKRLLAHDVGEQAMLAISRFVELCAPDTPINHRAYNLTVALAIFRGVREGWHQYADLPVASGQSLPVGEAK